MKRTHGISSLAAVLIFAGLLASAPATASPRIYVRVAPPAPIVETIPVAPSPRHVWVTGYHRWDGRAYVWVPGHYVVPRGHYRVWVAGHWNRHHRGWYWVPGHWRR
jgi:hypothetical protein